VTTASTSAMSETSARPPARPAPGTVIVFAHGAIVNGHEMALLRGRMKRLGYGVRQFRWGSITVPLEKNLERFAHFLAQTEADSVHVVGHSMGGVLARLLFERAPDPRPGRIVAIGSPLTDCWVGRKFGALHPRLPWLASRSVRDYLAREINPAWAGSRDFGALAGTYPFGIGTIFRDLPRPSDGVVLLDETKLVGLSDHATYRLNHFGMLLSKRCAAAVAQFLETGRFYCSGGL
jgi:pimeloyl-ACP methyl ester carboxylesterase